MPIPQNTLLTVLRAARTLETQLRALGATPSPAILDILDAEEARCSRTRARNERYNASQKLARETRLARIELPNESETHLSETHLIVAPAVPPELAHLDAQGLKDFHERLEKFANANEPSD